MKKVKGLLTIALVLSLMVCNFGVVSANSDITATESNGGGYTTLDEPVPKAF